MMVPIVRFPTSKAKFGKYSLLLLSRYRGGVAEPMGTQKRGVKGFVWMLKINLDGA
jgi:hypothetical protein